MTRAAERPARIRGVGIDIADGARVASLVARYRERFTRRWFSAAEIQQCDADPDPGRAYAWRFAVKEAVFKSLRLDGELPVPWLMIKVLAEPRGPAGGRPRVELVGLVGAKARAAGVGRIAVDWQDVGGVLVATAIAAGD